MSTTTGPKPPRLWPIQLPALAEVAADAVTKGDSREREGFTRSDFRGRALAFTSFAECRLETVRISEADLTGAHFTECVLVEVDAAVCRAPRSAWRQVSLTRSRLGSVELYESSWRSVLVEDSKLGFVNARTAQWQDVILRNCTVEELDLGSARIARLRLEGCRIGTLDVSGARLVDVDLRGAELGAINGLAGLAGATVTGEQLSRLAPLLAAHLGLSVL
jgi:uncharacterized protein YjbI with pentapeptide repeats